MVLKYSYRHETQWTVKARDDTRITTAEMTLVKTDKNEAGTGQHVT